jgi:hypothetical protein
MGHGALVLWSRLARIEHEEVVRGDTAWARVQPRMSMTRPDGEQIEREGYVLSIYPREADGRGTAHPRHQHAQNPLPEPRGAPRQDATGVTHLRDVARATNAAIAPSAFGLLTLRSGNHAIDSQHLGG